MNSCSHWAPSRRAVLAAGAGAAGLGLLPRAARPQDGGRDDGRPQVMTTIAQVAQTVALVGGDRIAVDHLMGEGVDPHTYRPTRSDIARLARADAVFWNGLYLEAQMRDVMSRLVGSRPVVAVAEALPDDRLLDSEDYAGRADPHVWMDVGLWARTIAVVRDALSDLDPAGAEVFAANAEAYAADLAALDDYVRRTTAAVVQERRVLVTAHDAFRYFGRAYGFEVVGIQGLSTESEAGVARIEQVVDLIVRRGVPAVFAETSVAARNVRALIDGARARQHQVALGGNLYSDAMGPPGTYVGTYIGMMDHNATTIAAALGAPIGLDGMTGRLTGVGAGDGR